MIQYYDIHTHKTTENDTSVLSIRNIDRDFWQAGAGMPCSLGLHPWHLLQGNLAIESLREYAVLHNVFAIGECGLDKLCDTEVELQQCFFMQQIQIANQLEKPLIIHCVRAFEELKVLLKQEKCNVPVVIHGFNKKVAVAWKMLAEGYYLSFGAALLNGQSAASSVFSCIPAAKFLLETDDAGCSIRDIYNAAAKIRKTGEETIILQVQNNFKNIFNK